MSRWLKILLLGLVMAGAGILLLPWWLGAALRPVLRAQGVAFDRYERVGYAHFRLHGVNYQGASFRVDAEQIETSTPLLWAWQCLRSPGPLVVAENWSVRITPPPDVAPSPHPAVTGMPGLQPVLRRIVPPLARWLPRAELRNGVIIGPHLDLKLPRADWEKSLLTVHGFRAGNQVAELAVNTDANGSLVLTAQSAEPEAKMQLTWRGADLTGEGSLWNQPLKLSAHFPDHGWLPTDATATATNWELPAARVKLGMPYAQVRGHAKFLWHDGVFDLSAHAQAQPAANDKTRTPPLTATAAAHGTLREITVTALQIDAPFAQATLTAPVTFGFDRPLAAESAQLTVRADLAQVPWLESARGKIDGVVTVAGDTAAARQTLELKSSDVVVSGFTVKSAQASAVLAWPLLELTQLRVQFDDASSLEAHGAVNWRTRELAGVSLQAKIGAASFARWLPAGAAWDTAELTATAEGPLDAARHQGTVKITGGQLPPLHPLTLDATWQGTGTTLEISAQAAAEKSTLAATGTLRPQGLQLTKLLFSPGGQPGWQLATPATIDWSPTWQVDGLQLAGSDGQCTFQGKGGPAGNLKLTVTHFPSTWLQDWVTITGPAWQIDSLQISAHAAERVLVFDTTLAAQIELLPQRATVSLVAHGDGRGLELKELKVTDSGRLLTQAIGRLPVSVLLEPASHLVFDESAALELTASTEADSPLWATLAAYTGLQLTKPEARINLKGTLRQPAGELQFNAARLSATDGHFRFPVPEFAGLALAVQFGRDTVTVTNFSAQVDGQAVSARGHLPMDDAHWQQLWRQPAAFDWSKAEAHVEIPDADLAAFARRFPNFLAAQGRLRARVDLAPGENFSGELHLVDAASRPIGPLGALRDLSADLVLADHLVTVQKFSATLGGEPVRLAGSFTLVPGEGPRLNLALKGTNLPLVRNTGLLVRTDLDLHADTDAAGLTRISGAVTIRDCLVLANINLRTLLPTGRRGVTRQPPYFAVLAEPFARWPLAVELRAPGTVRVRTTAYNGTASARFQLGGTLGEPRAVGQLTVDQGQVIFPFATFKVQQGVVRLREADPFRAVVNLTATSERRDYQLKLEMTGELPAPNLAITSTPSLEAADVLLMVMTGQPPTGVAGATGPASAAASSSQRLALLGAYLGRGVFQDLGFSGESRLEISAGEHVSAQGRETYEFEYTLGRKWSLVGEYDEFDAYNAGVKWRVYTQEGAPLEKK